MHTRIKPLLLKMFLAGPTLLIMITTAYTGHANTGIPSDIYVNIDKTTPRLREVFTAIEKQTVFSFAYDEADIVLTTKVRLSKGLQSVKKILDAISQQTGLYFTENENAS